MKLLRRVVLAYLVAVCLGGVVFTAVGFIRPASEGDVLAESATVSALEFAFRGEVRSGASWSALHGTASNGWLLRRAYVRGETPTGVRYSEQVLKVGWPFTMVRGFVRTVGDELRREGALAIQGDPTMGPIRFVPVQPVWPGVVIDAAVIAAALLVMVGVRRRWGVTDAGDSPCG